jgi:hypothetical protein
VTATATCPVGKILLGGGGQATNGTVTAGLQGKVALQESYPSGAATWTAVGVVTHDSGNGSPVTTLGAGNVMTVTAYVICTT